jgi:inner membrane protein
MPTVFTHPAVPLALGLGLGRDVISGRLLAAGVVASILPDLDVLAFRLGIPYASPYGHRGFTHSITFALGVALLGAVACRVLHASALAALLFLFVAAVSHCLLDCFTNGGLGMALFWPFSNERYFAPFQVIEVSPIGAAHLFTRRGATVIVSELFWVWLPCAVVGLGLTFWRRSNAILAAERVTPGGGPAVVGTGGQTVSRPNEGGTRMEPSNNEAANLARARAYVAAVERGADADELAAYLHPDAEAEAFPNRVTPTGRRYSRDEMLAGPSRGKRLLPDQRYKIRTAFAAGDRVVLEALWTGTLTVGFGDLASGTRLRAHVAMVLEFRDGLLIAQRNYDCYDPAT